MSRRSESAPVVLLGLALLLFAVPVAMGQGDDEEPPTPMKDDEGFYNIALGKDSVSLEALVSMASQITGRQFVFDDRRTQNKVFRFVGNRRVHSSLIFEYFQTLFITQDMAVVRLGPPEAEVLLLEDINTSKFIKQRTRFVNLDELESYSKRVGEIVATTIPLKHVSVEKAQRALNQILAEHRVGFVTPIEESNSLLVSNFAPTVWTMYRIIKAMDVEVAENQLGFEKLSLEYHIAEELAPIIESLIEVRTNVRSSGSASGRGNNRARTSSGEAPAPRIIPDARTNSLLVYATDEYMTEIKRLISDLDTEPTEPNSNIHIYELKNTNAEDIQSVLAELLGNSGRGVRGTGAGGTRTGRGGNVGGRSTAGAASSADEVNIVADANTNSLLITSTKARFEEIAEIVARLDKRRPQVLVQAAIVELSDNDVQNIGVELAQSEGGGSEARIFGGTAFGLSDLNTAAGGGDGGGDGMGGGDGDSGGGGAGGNFLNDLVRIPNIGSGGLIAGVFRNFVEVPLLVRMFKMADRGNLVSVPSILVNDNQPAHIIVGSQIPTTQVNQGQFSDQRSFAGYQDANLELNISPHISNDNYLRLNIFLQIEDFTGAGSADGAVPPPRSSREIETNITVRSGKTVVIGGLSTDNQRTTVQGVPLLSSIPILGELFKTTNEIHDKTTLYVFITPTILSEFEALERISYEKKLEISKLEGQIYLVDPNFRELELDDEETSIEAIESTGHLDLPRYRPSSPIPNRPDIESNVVPVKPMPAPNNESSIIPAGGRDGANARPKSTQRGRRRSGAKPTSAGGY